MDGHGEDIARRARSALIGAGCEIGVPGMTCHLSRIGTCTDGSIIAPLQELAGPCGERLRVGEDSPLLDFWAWDLCDVPQPDRVRAVVHFRGRVHRVTITAPVREQWGEVARFEPEIVDLSLFGDDVSGTCRQTIPLQTFRASQPDPLAGWERQWLRHLAQHHPGELLRLAKQHTPVAPTDLVKPWYADQSGIVLRVYRRDETQDVTIAFPQRVRCSCEAVQACRRLLTIEGDSGQGRASRAFDHDGRL